MNKGNADISSIVKITTSLKKILQAQKPHEQFRIQEQILFKQFFGENGDMIGPIIVLYIQAISQLNRDYAQSTSKPTSTPAPDAQQSTIDEAQVFVENMNTIIAYFAARQTNSELQQYKKEIETVKSEIDTKVSEILESNYIRGLSPSGIKSIQDLIYIWVQFDHSMKHLKELIVLEDTMRRNGTPLEPKTIDRSFRTFMELYADMAKSYGQKYFGETYNPEGISEKQAIVDGTLAFRNHWLKYTIQKLEDERVSIDDIWNDDKINGILQMVNQKVINLEDSEARKTKDAESMREAKENFLSRAKLASQVADSYETMKIIATKYKSIPIEDEEMMKIFIDAYRTVYMYEMLTDKQKPDDYLPKPNLRDYSLFILMQSKSFLGYEGKKFDPKVLIKRAIQDINIKESTMQFNRAFSKRIRNCILTCEDTDSSYAFNRMGHSYAPSQLVSITIPDESSKNPAKSIITTTYHEQSHILSGIKILSETATDFRAYTHYKQMLTKSILRRNVDVRSDNDLYEEVKADIAGIHGYMRALLKYPIGRTPEELKKEVLELKSEAEKKLKQKTDSPLMILKNKKWIKCSPIIVYDQIAFYVLNTRKKRGMFEKVLYFEYNKDGKPKTFEEILNNQQYELDQTRKYSSRMVKFDYGPSRNIDRIKFRMMIMMRRAIAYHKEEECIDLINKFLECNKDFIEKMGDDAFTKGFPNLHFPSRLQADACVKGFVRRGYEQDFENAEFMVGVYKLVRSLDEKNKSKDKNANGSKDSPDDQTPQ